MLSAASPFPFQQEIGFANRVGLAVDLLAVEVRGDLLSPFLCQLLQLVLGHGQHTAGPHRPHRISHRWPTSISSATGRKTSLAMSLHGVPRREVFAGLLVVLFVETPDQLLEDRPHTVVVEARGAGWSRRCS